MTRHLQTSIVGVSVGLAIGAAAAVRWLVVSVPQYGDSPASVFVRSHPRAFATLLLALAAWAAYLAIRLPRRRPHSLLVPATAAIGGTAFYVSMRAIACALAEGSPALYPWTAAAMVLLAALAALRRSWPSTALVVLALALLIPQTRQAHLLFGDRLARMALEYAAPPGLEYYGPLILSVAVIGGLAGWFATALEARRDIRLILWGTAGGVFFAVMAASVQTLAFFVAMRVGHSPGPIVAVVVGAWAAAGAAAVAAAPQWMPGAARTPVRFSPALIAVAAVAWGLTAGYGYRAYEGLSLVHTDTVYAYVHFGSDGTWRRTLDDTASRVKVWRAHRFLAAYPYSAYRPAAMLAAAESEFQLWRFSEADRILDDIIRDYPVMAGYARVLKAINGLAAGDPGPMLSAAPADSTFARWRRTLGAQMAAAAAERAGLLVQARGYHSAYIDFMLSTQGASWTSESVSYSRSHMEAIAAALKQGRSHGCESDADNAGLGLRSVEVKARVTAGGRPLRGARVALVQPHVDAALPGDSQQFTGPRTVAAWSGLWAMTDRNGAARIADVPFGRYQVVLGLDFASSPVGYVVSRPVAEVTVDRRRVEVAPIALVPAVRLISPRQSESVSPPVSLSWEAYPGAAAYSVSVLWLGRSELYGQGSRRSPTATTCWARAGIAETSVDLDAEHFLNSHPALRTNHSYAWIVYAYDSEGRLLSSSEHYFDLTERIFTVKQDKRSLSVGPLDPDVPNSTTRRQSK